MTIKELTEKIKKGKPLTEAERVEVRALLREKMVEFVAEFKAKVAKREGTR